MNRRKFLQKVRRQIHYVFARNEIENELDQHLQDSVESLVEEGLSWEEAEKQAILQMGDPVEIGKQLNKEHNPVMGYLMVLTRIALVLLIYPVLTGVYAGVSALLVMASPMEVLDWEEKHEINLNLDTPMHYVTFDELYLLENGNHCVTYRTYQKFWKSRSHGTFHYDFLDEDGNEIFTAYVQGGSGLVTRNSANFIKDEMKSVFIHSRDGQVLEISLEGDSYETK